MHGVNRYQNVAAQTASPQRLMVMLFQATRKHLAAAAQALEAGQVKEAQVPLQKAQDIVNELMATLNPAVSADLCQQLSAIYTFVLTRLLNASMRNDAKSVRDAERVFTPVAVAFEEAVEGQGRAP
jgi:flagellar protein FliS